MKGNDQDLYARLMYTTHLWSLPGTRRCILPLGCDTFRCSCTARSSTGRSQFRSSPLWNQQGSGTAAHWWGGWAETEPCRRRWREGSCRTSAPIHTSCSFHRAHADRCCHQMVTPGEKISVTLIDLFLRFILCIYVSVYICVLPPERISA